MTTARTATLALAAALGVAASGCNGKCNDATPPVASTPSTCTAVAGQDLTVPLHTCPRCDQETPTCDVRATGSGRFTLEPVSQVCDPKSCPIPNLDSCAALATNCVLTAAMTIGLTPGDPASLDIVTEAGVVTKPLVIASSGTPQCSP
jgi:hypothetical protein